MIQLTVLLIEDSILGQKQCDFLPLVIQLNVLKMKILLNQSVENYELDGDYQQVHNGKI